jgi:hypothetical protein
MEKPLKLHSSDSGIGEIRVYPENIESYFDYDSQKDESSLEDIFEDLGSEIITWGDEVLKILKKSKSVQAINLVKEYEEIYIDYISKIENQMTSNTHKKYRVIKMHSGIFYTVKETLAEIDTMMEELNYNEKYGIY